MSSRNNLEVVPCFRGDDTRYFYFAKKWLAVLLVIFLSFSQQTQATEAKLSLTLQNTNLPDAIRIIAKFLKMNVILSPSVQGAATLQLTDANPQQALNILLTSHDLAKWQSGNVLFIAPQEELIKRQQDELKWREVTVEAEPLLTRFWQIKYGKAEEIARLIQDDHGSLLSKRGRVRVDARTNIICIQDVAGRLVDANKLIQKLDVPVKQILIEARLASVDNDFERELGINFVVNPPSSIGTGMAAPAVGHYSLAVVKLADGSQLDVKLSALESEGHAELISSPSLFTANQQPASIEAGEEVPYQEVSNSGGTAVSFKKAVLGLKVTPQVLPGNKVLLQLQINQDRPSDKMVLGVPTISTRQIMTSVLIKAGQTVVLGGIFENNLENGQQGLPFISKIPVVGWLFKQQKTKRSKRELLIFVTPNIITQEI
jgi:type IV pilus assembly protein PilQ